MIIFLMLLISACTKSDNTPATGVDTFSISGKVTVDGAPMEGVTMTLLADGEVKAETTVSGVKPTLRLAANLLPATTDASGNYSFSGLGNGTYTVVPQNSGYTFDDVSTVTIINGAPVNNVDFVATTCAETYGISGRVTFLGIVAPATKQAGQAGVIGKTSGGDSPDVAGLPGVTIQLTIASVDVTRPAGVTGKLSGLLSGDDVIGTTITDGTGYYSFPGVAPGQYYVTPVNTNYVFNPSPYLVTIDTDSVFDINWAAKAATFSQADLVGTWRMNLLRTGIKNEWTRAMIRIDDSSGVASCLSMSNSTDAAGCPDPFDLTLTIDQTGVITQTGADAADGDTGHMTMTSNKNFMAGTGTTGSTEFLPNKNSITKTTLGDSAGSYHLALMQKVVDGTAYSNIDLRNKSFVFHGMQVGTDNGWAHGTGTTNAAGVISMDTPTVSGDAVVTLPTGLTISVNSAGVVTISGNTTFQGFLSDDRKTIVGTDTYGGVNYQLIIIQILGQTYPDGTLPGQMAAGHSLATGGSGAFWAHYKIGAALGTIYFYNWEASNFISAPTSGFFHGTITSTGTVTVDEDDTYHGQMSHDGLFQVSTQTEIIADGASQNQGTTAPGTEIYMLSVATKPGLQRLVRN
jgi:hypothetical protein